MKVSQKILLFILQVLFGKDQKLKNLSRKQRLELIAVAKRAERRYERYIKHVRDALGSEVFADKDFAQHVHEIALDYSKEFL